MLIDLRSDTVTRPTPAMLDAMLQAKVGDDVFEEDPTVNRLETMAAGLFKMEAALYCASGTMSNQIAIRCHTQPADEVICENEAHVYIYEGGGMAANSGVQARPLKGNNGLLNASQIEEAINPDDVHKARTSLVCIENTSNRGGGTCYDLNEIEKISGLCRQYELSLHLDGARLFNAMVEKNTKPSDYGQIVDSIAVCLNKGLGCPAGSLLLGTKAFIKEARRRRKIFGGGMRQVGFLAASGIYALENNVTRLKGDHESARAIALALMDKPFVQAMVPVETNIILFDVKENFSAAAITDKLREKGILAIAISAKRIRLVTHLDISDEMVASVIQVIRNI